VSGAQAAERSTRRNIGRKRIAFLNERMLQGFGVDLVIDQVASELSRRGHDVTVYASVADMSGSRDYRLKTVPTRASGIPTRYNSSARWWAEYIDAHEHDVVLVESHPFFSLIPRLKMPAIAVDHGVSSTEGMSRRQRGAFRYIKWAQHRRHFPRAAAIVTVSEFVRSLLPRRLQERTDVIYNGVDHYAAVSDEARTEMRERIGLRDDEVAMLYVGRLNPEGQPYKGTLDLMRASARWKETAPQIRVVMAGQGSEEDASRIRQAGGIPLPNVPAGDMAALCAAADIYVTASRWEGFDLPIMEAAHQGVPGVALRVGAHPEVVRDGETGILADSPEMLFSEAEALAGDPDRRALMGAAAREWAAEFTWAKATHRYEEVLGEVAERGRAARTMTTVAPTPLRPAEPAAEPMAETDAALPTSDVTAVILNYGASDDVLDRCVASLVNQTYGVQVLLVDNASPKNQAAVDLVAGRFPQIGVLKLDKNYGFAGGINRGITAATTDFVLLVNNDTELAPNAVEEMRKLIDGREDVVGVAPKILLEDPAGYIDAIGNLVDWQGQAYNMGIGQLDIGQYDRVEETFGACFAATLIRSEAFRPGMVGPMDEKYFMYYEDVDWCFRAGILGYKFLTCPTAVVSHTHSMTTRQLAYGYKYRMIMRNFARTLLKDFQGRRAYRATVKRCLGLTRNVIFGPYRWASFLAIKDITLGFPSYVRARGAIQGRRKVNDQTLFDFSHGEQSFFEPTGYRPVRNLEALHSMYRRRYLITGDENDRMIAQTAADIAGTRIRFDRDLVREKLRPLFENEPQAARDYLDQLDS
jgi:GT2 family glycosyltransferase/glycosyltransferase involved in cell wall biosynthesis